MKYIAYYRVSTKQQGNSGLGLEAQKQIVKQHLKSEDQLITEYIEIETGKNNYRPQLTEAIEHTKEAGATLIIAKLDRLSRNITFIFQLRDTKVPFVCCDIPDANTMSIGIFATMAQHEREMMKKNGVPEAKIHVLPMGVDSKRFQQDHRQLVRDLFAIQNPLVLFCGYKNFEKGALTLLKAIPLIFSEKPAVNFMFIGPPTIAFNYTLKNVKSK